MKLTQLKQSKTELKRRNDKDITNKWQNSEYFIFYLHPSEGPRPRATREGEKKYLIYYTRDFPNYGLLHGSFGVLLPKG
jgi:hypothetical protein